MKFICEHCGKQYDDHEDALRCEEAHKEEIEREAEKRERLSDINLLVNNYIRDYDEFPNIKIDGDKATIAIKSLISHIDYAASMLFE